MPRFAWLTLSAAALLVATPAFAAGRAAAKQAVRSASRAKASPKAAKAKPKPKAAAKARADRPEAKPPVKGLVNRASPLARPGSQEKDDKRPGVAGAIEDNADAPLSARGPTRVDFDERLIEGQTKTGAVYLFDRKETQIRSMVEARKSYRDELLATVYE